MKALYAAEHPVGNPPLGYDIQYRQLVPNKSEAKTVNYIFERYLALSNVIRLKQELDREPLPHQITAVYESMLPRQPLRYVLADDPGAGKSIMAGLFIRELLMRADANPHKIFPL